jgi:hypothetical protein
MQRASVGFCLAGGCDNHIETRTDGENLAAGLPVTLIEDFEKTKAIEDKQSFLIERENYFSSVRTKRFHTAGLHTAPGSNMQDGK